MPKEVIFETELAIFHFELSDGGERLRYYSIEHRVSKATEVLEAISSASSEDIRITSDYFAYIVLDLLRQKKGSIFCKPCRKTYLPDQLHSVPIGFGKTPFEVNIMQKGGIIKRLFGRKSLICGEGGTAYECPKGHELISAITWIGTLRIPDRKPHWPL